MAFTDAERDKIRTYMGVPRLYISSNSFLEQAMTSVQSIADNGSAPDSSIEEAIRGIIQTIDNIEGSLTQIESQYVNLAVHEVPASLSNGATLKQDYSAAIRRLRMEGTHQIQKIAIRLGIQPIRPYFFSDGLQANARQAYMPSFFRKG